MIRRGRAVTVLMAAFLGGCPPPWHTHDTVEVLFQGGQPLNPDEAGESRPLQVRFYQLKDDARFLSAYPTDLALNDEGILDQHLLIRREIRERLGVAPLGQSHGRQAILADAGNRSRLGGEGGGGGNRHGSVDDQFGLKGAGTFE